MNLSRRSFLAAVMGAVAASAFKSESALTLPQGAFALTGQDEWMRHYAVWDSVTVAPGGVLAARLLPPPLPDDFTITGIGLGFNSEAEVDDLRAAGEAIRFRMSLGKLDLIEAGRLFFLSVGRPFQLMQPIRFTRDDDFGLFLDSYNEPVRTKEPVTVSIILHGTVRFDPSAADLAQYQQDLTAEDAEPEYTGPE